MSTAEWMSRVPDAVSTTISIPGTHQSMSMYGGPQTKCQSTSLLEQYEAGIRFVDIRCRHYNDQLLIFHGEVPQQASFDNVLEESTRFLKSRSTEVIFMRVKEEYRPQNSTLSFAESVLNSVDRFPIDAFYDGEGHPSVGEARGKLVILRDYGGSATFGLPYADFDIEDEWLVSTLLPEHLDKKWNSTKRHLEMAERAPAGTAMYLTYFSGGSPFASPESLAERINNYLQKFLTGKNNRWGIIAMDFPSTALIEKIIDSNF